MDANGCVALPYATAACFGADLEQCRLNGKSKLADAHPETTHSTATGAKAGELRDARACAFGGGMHEKHPNPGMGGPTHPGAGCVWFLSGPARGCTRLFVFGGAMRGCCVAFRCGMQMHPESGCGGGGKAARIPMPDANKCIRNPDAEG